ncbi:RNase H [Helcococcus ovis]|uniref:ribonuclease H1 domain-containing protein n=1 Tax=Helcococcus ovis TaxID=72026 RepID=UPI0010705DB9|nr:ribonuclease H family protein [Helcococcus ovis]TFF68489.1 RNase H [Helcococcus ovis]WNZ01453.1 ribonuclease H family protein [Helcococcus ovis]
MSKKYYAVRVGRKTGIFSTWDECSKQVIGFKGAIYKSFLTKEAAQNFVGNIEKVEISKDSIKDNEIIAYVDGSYNISTGEFGYGVILLDNHQEITFNKVIYDDELKNQRNVAGEVFGSMAAIGKAIELKKSKIYIHFDYMGIKAWAIGEWKTNIQLTKDYKKFIDEKSSLIDIEFIKVKAHSNNKYNDIADRLAKNAVGIK